MKIFGIMVVKNEADIIGPCLDALSTWIDKVFVLDNGSSDGTWEIVNEKASDIVMPYRQDFGPFRRSLRAEIFNHYRAIAKDGDWWYIADSDEFLVSDPRDFLSRVPSRYHVVYKKSIDYVLTESDVSNHEFTGDFERDKPNFIHILPRCWSEQRFFRYRSRMKWGLLDDKPAHIGLAYPETLPVRHYQCRSPEQMQKRIDVRLKIPRDKTGRPFRHVTQTGWRELLQTEASVLADPGEAGYHDLLLSRRIRPSVVKYVLKRVLHGLRILP